MACDDIRSSTLLAGQQTSWQGMFQSLRQLNAHCSISLQEAATSLDIGLSVLKKALQRSGTGSLALQDALFASGGDQEDREISGLSAVTSSAWSWH